MFLGDSITQGWEGNGKDVWAKEFDPLKEIMPDYLHLSKKGYETRAEAIRAPVEELLKK